MMLQAQTLTRGRRYIDERECSTPREAEDFRRDFERLTGLSPDEVLIVPTCSPRAVQAFRPRA
jgi:hypothetical protein